MLSASCDKGGALPPWAYRSRAVFDSESDLLFRRHWQIVFHISDLVEQGDYVTLDIVGERVFAVRGRDGVVRAFHNSCRHRGARVAAGLRGNFGGTMACPFHGWAYELSGALRGASRPSTFPSLTCSDMGLHPVECEIWHGFVFVRISRGPQPSVACLMKRHEREVQPYEAALLAGAGGPALSAPVHANWKSIRDVDNEGYHVSVAHPSLNELYGGGYIDEPFINGTSRAFGSFNRSPGRRWAVNRYKALLPDVLSLPESHRRAWLYIRIFPNMAISFYPDSVNFYQEIPVSEAVTINRGAVYRAPGETRELRACRFLSGKIDGQTMAEDAYLAEMSFEATSSVAFNGGILSDLEICVQSHHDLLRLRVPSLSAACASEPPAGVTA